MKAIVYYSYIFFQKTVIERIDLVQYLPPDVYLMLILSIKIIIYTINITQFLIILHLFPVNWEVWNVPCPILTTDPCGGGIGGGAAGPAPPPPPPLPSCDFTLKYFKLIELFLFKLNIQSYLHLRRRKQSETKIINKISFFSI